MSDLLVVLPILSEAIAAPCIDSIRAEGSSFGIPPSEVVIVDNTRHGIDRDRVGDFAYYRDPDGHNLGVARSWNVGAQAVMERGLDYLVILSASMLFGPELHITWREQMDRHWGSLVIENTGNSWHLIAIHADAFRAAGLFDSNFYPGYFEAVDWHLRLIRSGECERARNGTIWPNLWVNAMSRGVAMHAPFVDTPPDPLLEYYCQKWGGAKGEETHTLPWGNKPLDYFEDVPIPVLAERYGLSRWW